MFIFGKNKELLARLEEYLSELEASMNQFEKAVEYLLNNGLDEHFKILAKKMHLHESRADDIRRDIEKYMYQKSLLPETREDLLNIIEIIDKIPNAGQYVLNDFIVQKTQLYDGIKDKFAELLETSIETFKVTVEATRNCFGKRDRINEYSAIVDRNESLGDGLERHMIAIVFDSALDKAEMILQRDLVVKLGNICDLSEIALDRIVICSIKRYV